MEFQSSFLEFWEANNIYTSLFLQTSLEIDTQLIAIHKIILSLVKDMYERIKKGVWIFIKDTLQSDLPTTIKQESWPALVSGKEA